MAALGALTRGEGGHTPPRAGGGSPCSLRALSTNPRLCNLPGSPLSVRARRLFLSFLRPILLFRILLLLVLRERFAGVRTVANAIWWGSSKPPLFPPPRSLNLLIYPFFLILALFFVFCKFFLYSRGTLALQQPIFVGDRELIGESPPIFSSKLRVGCGIPFLPPIAQPPWGRSPPLLGVDRVAEHSQVPRSRGLPFFPSP